MLVVSVIFFVLHNPVQAQQPSYLQYIESADGGRSRDNFSVIRNTHARLMFSKDIARIAVGNPAILEMEVLAGREILMIAKNIGKTSVIVWYSDQTAEPLMFDVTEDLTVLVGVLKDIHPAIQIEMAPDRAALILRGTVPDIRIKMDAENAARSYLSSNASGSFEIFTPTSSPSDANEAPVPRIAIINLLKTDEAVMSTEQKIIDAIAFLTTTVSIKRVSKGQISDDALDTFILEGQVDSQVMLTRVLTVAASIIGSDDTAITVVSDEGGGISDNAAMSLVGANIARAKMLSVADGRILSMINVKNIPQVRVAVKIHEVNRSRLRDWKPSIQAISNNFQTGSLSDAGDSAGGGGGAGSGRSTLQDSQPGSFSVRDIDVANALQIINGTLSNNIQIATQDVAFDLLFGMMEEEGISRVLSNPTLTVLSGESAVFEVGGQVPVPSSFSPAGNGVIDTSNGQAQPAGVYSSVEFKRYGVTLNVFPLVDENGLITLDVNPEISQPDITLTRQIAAATGSSSQTTSFNSRSLQTRAQVRDGQPMIIGGLITRSSSNVESYPQGIGNFAPLGDIARNSNRAEVTTELIIVVTPTIVQPTLLHDGLWQYPDALTLLQQSVGVPGIDTLPGELRRRAMYE